MARGSMLRAAAFLGLLGVGQAYVCQVMTQEDASLQETLGVHCNVTLFGCACTSSFLTGAGWVFVSRVVNESMRHGAKPGEWYVTDASGQCAMSLGPSKENVTLEPTPQPCPPGFYCAGGLHPPRSCAGGDHCPGRTAPGRHFCPAGFFCPTPGSSLMPCPNGAHCPERSQSPQACDVGNYCREGQMLPCPRGHYCPFGSNRPRPCEAFARCPPGSKSQGVFPSAALLLSFCVGVVAASAHFYDHIVSHAWEACALCSGMLAMMWLADEVIAGFLSLLVVVVVANWALLQVGSCPPVAARLLLLATVSVAIVLLGLANPSWSLLAGGLVLCGSLGWLMSRQSFAVVLAGRVLLAAAFLVLLAALFRIDPHFTLAVAGLLLLLVGGLLASWFLERRRQQQRVALPFMTRWRWRSTVGSFEGPGGETTLDAVSRSALLSLRPRRAAEPAAANGNCAAAVDTGISFCLQGVSFDLLDGKRLLRDVSLNIAAGKRVAVMGPSGSGKSTLLAVLSGRASYGHVVGQLFVGGRPADDLRFLQHVTGFVPQDDVLHGELTVEENVRFQAALRLPEGTTPEQVQEQVAGVAGDLGIKAILQERVGTPERRGVSGGQRKRVSIAMELVAQPLLLFADEPTSGLDSTTSHDVVRCLNEAAARLGTTVISVIHQPRYETLRLFDDLVLLGTGGCLVYSGATGGAMEHFQGKLQVVFPANTNPADVLLDAIQPPKADAYAEVWRNLATPVAAPTAEVPPQRFYRQRPPFFRAVLIYMDRSLLQSIRAHISLAVSQVLCVATTVILCVVITYDRLDQFVMQSAFAALFLMLLQGVASQRVFGADLLTTWREARVGMPMVAYLVAKDLAALFEITLSAAVFTAAYGSVSGAELSLHRLFAGSWAFVYTTFGLNYIFSIILSPSAAQMSAVVSSFISFCVAGVYQPQLPEIVSNLNGRGWMIPALSPIRWLFGFLLTEEAGYLTDIARAGADGTLRDKGYDLKYLDECGRGLGVDSSVATLQQAWESNRGWVCSTAPLLLLGLIFRFLAGLCLMLFVHAQTSGWARFFAQSNEGAWKLAGHLFKLLVGAFLAVFLFAEIWTFGILNLEGARAHSSRPA